MRLIRSILAVSMAFLVLFASTSFTVGLHQCGGKIQSVALFGKADQCPMEKQPPSCHLQLMKSCCEDHEVLHEGEDFQAVTSAFDFHTSFVSIISEPPVLISEVVDVDSAFANHIDYDPPIRSRDITISLQVFLI